MTIFLTILLVLKWIGLLVGIFGVIELLVFIKLGREWLLIKEDSKSNIRTMFNRWQVFITGLIWVGIFSLYYIIN